MFFFFQAEDGIRDTSVTGVQTCALPISGTRGFLNAKIPFELLSQIHAFNSHRPSPSELFLQTSASPAKPAGATDERLSGTTYSTATNSMRFSCGTGA